MIINESFVSCSGSSQMHNGGQTKYLFEYITLHLFCILYVFCVYRNFLLFEDRHIYADSDISVKSKNQPIISVQCIHR